MQFTNLHIDTQIIVPTFRQKLEDKLDVLWLIPMFFLTIIVGVPLLILVFVLYIFPKYLYNKFIFGKDSNEEDMELEIDIWSKLYQGNKVEIESLEIYPDDEFDDTRWNGRPLMKLRTIPDNTDLNELYFLTESITFSNSLILFEVNKDIEIRQTKIIQLDLVTLEIKLIEELDDFYDPTFNSPDNETLIIQCKQGHKKIVITLRTKERTKEIQPPT